jgi:DNA-binding CsgD family transcriptional regulator
MRASDEMNVLSVSRELDSAADMPFEEQDNGSSVRVLVGRNTELGLIARLVDRVSRGGEALLLFGEAGVGKTVLLDAAAAMGTAAGTRVLRASGVEFEADVAYAGLHQLLLPVHEEIADLDAAHRDSLNVALGFGTGPVPGQLVVCAATLTLLCRAAATRPLIAIVDDLPWLDRPSALVLGFVARRLTGTRVGFLAASRSGEESFFDRVGLPQLDVGPLDGDMAVALMSAQFPCLERPVRDRLLAEAQGNPLALLGLPAAVSRSGRGAPPPVTATLPVSRRLQASYASRIAALPPRTRELLLLMALEGTGDFRVFGVVRERGPWLADFDLAEQAGLVQIDKGSHRPVFRHPLIRSTVVEISTSEQRRRAHEALAEVWVDQPDRLAWHLGHARVEPDEEVAALLERAAYHNLQRGDGVGAVSALTRAADLSPQSSDRARRLADAAYIGADVTGELRSASQLMADANRADPQVAESLRAAATAAFVLLNGDGDVETAHRLLVGAIANTKADGGPALAEALHVLALLCFFGGREEMWAPFHEAVARFEPDVPAALYLIGTCFADPLYRAVPALPKLERAIAGLATETDPTVILKIAFAAGNTDRLSACRRALLRIARGGFDAGAIGSAIQASTVLAFESWWGGGWDESTRWTDETLELCAAHGFPLFAFCVRHVQAAVAAARGDDAGAAAAVDAMVQWAAPRGAGFVEPLASYVRTLTALGRGDFEQAYRSATAISPAGTLRSHELMVQWVLMDVVEAAIRTGRFDEAAAHVTAMREANVAAVSPRVALLAAGAAAIAAPDPTAPTLFAQAIAIPGAERWPFDLARVELAYGERLRRLRRMKESRQHLTAALRAFEHLGARPWAERAGQELRAAGQTKPRSDQSDRDALTAQEHEIASLAASGLSNKEIGQRLFLSHRTVGAHLYRIFPKLGIASRAALRDALAALPTPTDSIAVVPQGARMGARRSLYRAPGEAAVRPAVLHPRRPDREIVDTVHHRRSPMISASAGLRA